MKNKTSTGHLLAFLTIVIWGTTFISTKVLLQAFLPVEILFIRFVMGYIALLLAHPHRLKTTGWRQEFFFAMAGICGVSLYYLLENIALTYTMVSNVGVIISVAPFFTAILTHLFMRGQERLHVYFFGGFAVSMVGIYLINFNGTRLHMNPLGDLLAVLAAFVWACYSILVNKISRFGYPTVQTTRRIFKYGVLFILPAFFAFPPSFDAQRFTKLSFILNLLFLGLGASALCFVTWNFAVKVLGSIRTSIYIYMVPVITVFSSALILHERIASLSLVGTTLTLVGLFVSERGGRKKNVSTVE